MTTKKKTAKKSTRSKPAKAAKVANLTMDSMRELSRDTELELTVRVRLGGVYSTSFDVLDGEGDEHAFIWEDVISARIAPKAKVKVSGEGAERAAEILREKGFDVS
jgi:hypothetical protein